MRKPIAAIAALAAFAVSACPAVAQDEPTVVVPVPPGANVDTTKPDEPEVAPEKLALAREIVAKGYPEEARETMFFGVVDQMVEQMRTAGMAQMPSDDPGLRAVVDQWIDEYIAGNKQVLRAHIPKLMGALAYAYAENFSTGELQDIRDFVSTPSGQALLLKSTSLIGDPHFKAANQAYMSEIMAGLPAARQELVERLTRYLERKKAAPPTTAS